ncbi:MAG TPA: thioredoxin domain-containing protein, partial [Bacteroidales bacterium]|nr:thioredoxin domain-containing protein [Bacteroidales bacterium]
MAKGNKLNQAGSPYLRQHAANPVHWQEWSESTLQLAKEEDKPLIISIGYASCHWCHVMGHETFSNPQVAAFMNEHFVCIKIDREERPDIDQIYMEAAQMLNGSGGWPLHAFALPDGRPFHA